MRVINILFHITFLLCFLLGCKSSPQVKPEHVIDKDIQYLDSLTASKMIVDADVDDMLDNMSMIDIAIQMKKEDGFNDVNEARKAYKSFIATQVEDFNDADKIYMNKVFSIVNDRLKKLNPDLIIPSLKLIKLKLDHYGEDVYYTRGDIILLPKNTLSRSDTKGQSNVMLHEIWHILSRNNSALKEKAYNLIGFKPFPKKIYAEEPLSQMILTNPDGVSMDYTIDLGDGINAVPIIKSTRKKFDMKSPRFFDYFNFDLYAVNDDGKIITDINGGSTIPAENNNNFFKKIKDNTQYIIHPDEIIADNFMLTVNANANQEFDKYSPEGTQLIKDFLDILKNFKR